MHARTLLFTALCSVLSFACSAELDDAGDEDFDASEGAVDLGTNTIIKSEADLPTAGLTVTFGIRKESGKRSEVITLARGSKKAKLTCQTSTTIRSNGEGLLASACTDKTLPGYAPGVNHCTVVFNVVLPTYEVRPMKAECYNPASISAEQKKLLEVIYGSAPYPTVPNRTFAHSTGEVAGEPIPVTMHKVGSDVEKDPMALAARLNEAVAPLLGAKPTLSDGQPIAFDAPANMASVFLSVSEMKAPINVMSPRMLAVGKDISLAGTNGKMAAKTEMTARFKASVGVP